jgi:hypothetical protein
MDRATAGDVAAPRAIHRWAMTDHTDELPMTTELVQNVIRTRGRDGWPR